MTLPQETLATGAPTICPDCGEEPALGVYQSAAGFYVGSYCGCGPYSRESGYYGKREHAEMAFKSQEYAR